MSKLSPWLAHGCLSPRLLYEEVKRYERLSKRAFEAFGGLQTEVFHAFPIVF